MARILHAGVAATALLACVAGEATAAQTETRTIAVDGIVRDYCLYVPDTPADPPRYVFYFHGGGAVASANGCIDGVIEARWRAKADAEGFVFVAPLGTVAWSSGGSKRDACSGPPKLCQTARAWNACSAPPEVCKTVRADNGAEANNVDDVGFFEALWTELVPELEDARVYLNGMSNGGMLVYLLACHVPDLIDAASVMAGTAIWQTCLAAPVPFFHMHGDADTVVPWPDGNETWPSPLDSFHERESQNFSVAESLLDVVNCDHGWPGVARLLRFRCTTAFKAEDRFWAFFEP